MKNKVLVVPQKKYSFHIMRELAEIEQLTSDLPDEFNVWKYVSVGGFSSIGFVKFVAERTKINKMVASTLRVGKKHLAVIDNLYKQGKIEQVHFIVGSIMKNDSASGKSYGYYDNLVDVCKNNGWKVSVKNNHSKILLFDTLKGKYVLETSSNLNENPKMEQFSFEKSEQLYNLYEKVFEEVRNDST